MRNYAIYISLILLAFFCACKQNSEQEEIPTNDQEYVELPRGFDEFYNQFHQDSVFQIEHIAFPLENNTNTNAGRPWTKENWIMHKSFNSANGAYSREFSTAGNIVLEIISDKRGIFLMERRFAKMSDGWNLIFYKISHPAMEENSENALESEDEIY